MVCNLSVNAATALAACPVSRPAPDRESGSYNAYQSRPSMAVDILSIGANPALTAYMSRLFQRFGWTIRTSASLDEVRVFLENNRAAVAVCEESWLEGGWQDVLAIVNSIPNGPKLVVIGNGEDLVDEVAALGGFDALMPPLDNAEVIWSVASAWRDWMESFESPQTRGPRCSDA